MTAEGFQLQQGSHNTTWGGICVYGVVVVPMPSRWLSCGNKSVSKYFRLDLAYL